MSLPNFIVKFAMERAGAYVGGPIGAALAAIGATGAFAVAEVGNLVNRTNSEQPVRLSDVAAATAAVEAALYSAGVYGTAVGSATVAAPGLLIGGLIIAVGVAATYHKNPTASLDAFETFWNTFDGSRPWEAAARAAKAYSAEKERQRAIDAACNRKFIDCQNWTPPRDPLVLDLNGGGIQTIAIDPARPILFDMDGDGTKHATGWVAAGEAIVVRDINGNGLIDSGRELFGDAAVIPRGQCNTKKNGRRCRDRLKKPSMNFKYQNRDRRYRISAKGAS